MIRDQKPYLLIGSPACKAFSSWMTLNRAKSSNRAEVDCAKIRAKLHIEFVMRL